MDAEATLSESRIAGPAGGPELSVVIPSFNERDNVEPLLNLLEAALAGIRWEAIVVDDNSPDGTSAIVRARARQDYRVRCLQRVGRRGLASASIEGMLASAGAYIAVIDADMQHDERLLPQMLDEIQHGGDVAVGSRYIHGGDIGRWDPRRAKLSAVATHLCRVICKTDIGDPMSGFFMIRREVFERALPRLSARGFKILLDSLASSPDGLQVKELPYTFREQRHGDSKLDALVIWESGMLIADKLVGGFIPIRFALFGFIGIIGLGVHLATLRSALAISTFSFIEAQSLATLVAMTSNFLLNNYLTYRDQRLRGIRLVRGLCSFYLICAVGAVANVGVASYLFSTDHKWWLAGIAGALVGSVWNYALSSVFTWRMR